MNTIYKFTTRVGDTTVAMQRGALIRRFSMQRNEPCIWAEVDASMPMMTRKLQIFGTGHPLSEGAVYIGSCDDGPFVWHLYEVL